MAQEMDPKQKNVFTELFGEKTPQGPDLMGAVSRQKEQAQKTFLDEKPRLDAVRKPEKAHVIRRSKPGALFLQMSIMALLLIGAFFYTQNTASFKLFGGNPASKAVLAQEQVHLLEAEVAVQRYLNSVLILDQYASQADAYFYNLEQSQANYNSENKKAEFQKVAKALRPELGTLIESLQKNLESRLEREQIELGKTVIATLIQDLKDKSGEVDEQHLLQDIQDLETAKTLLQSQNLVQTVLAMDPESFKDEELLAVYTGYSEVNKSVTAVIAAIQSSRIDWVHYFTVLEELTKVVDPLFNTNFSGNLKIESVSFSTFGTASVRGTSLTEDTKNFTLISNLMDTYEMAQEFLNVQQRTFSKREDSESYSGDFQVDMELDFKEANPNPNE